MKLVGPVLAVLSAAAEVAAVVLVLALEVSDPVKIATITAVLGPVMLAMVTRREIKSRVGTPNGQGNVVEMLEKLIESQAGQDRRLAEHDRRLARLEARHDPPWWWPASWRS